MSSQCNAGPVSCNIIVRVAFVQLRRNRGRLVFGRVFSGCHLSNRHNNDGKTANLHICVARDFESAKNLIEKFASTFGWALFCYAAVVVEARALLLAASSRECACAWISNLARSVASTFAIVCDRVLSWRCTLPWQTIEKVTRERAEKCGRAKKGRLDYRRSSIRGNVHLAVDENENFRFHGAT